MPSNKLARTNDDIQFVLSKLLPQVKDPRVQQGMISVTRVETTGDLRYSKIWLSVLGMKDEKDPVAFPQELGAFPVVHVSSSSSAGISSDWMSSLMCAPYSMLWSTSNTSSGV